MLRIHSLCSLSYDRSIASSKSCFPECHLVFPPPNFQYLLISLRSPRSCLHPPPSLPVTSIPPLIFPSMKCLKRQVLCNMCPIQLVFLLFIVCRMFLSSLTLYSTSSFIKQLVQLISILLQHHISKCSGYFPKYPIFHATQRYASNVAHHQFLP